MNKLFAIILTLFLSLPISVWAVDENIQTENPTKIEESAPIVNSLDEDIVEQEKNEENQFKQPTSKRKIAKKFLAAMGGVGISSFAIFFLLTVYNRIREGFQDQINTTDAGTSLETPQNMNEAIKSFLDKTNWF